MSVWQQGRRSSTMRPVHGGVLVLAGLLTLAWPASEAAADPSGVAAAVGAGVLGLVIGNDAAHHGWGGSSYPVYINAGAPPVVYAPVGAPVIYTGAYPVVYPMPVSAQPVVYVRPTY